MAPTEARRQLALALRRWLRRFRARFDRRNVEFEVVVLAVDAELSVYGIHRDDGYRLVARRARHAVWNAAHTRATQDPPFDRWETPLDKQSFLDIRAVWTSFVTNIRVPDRGDGFSTPEYYFSMYAGDGWMTGYAYGPKSGTCLAGLVRLEQLLFDMARTGDVVTRAKELRALLLELRAMHPVVSP